MGGTYALAVHLQSAVIHSYVIQRMFGVLLSVCKSSVGATTICVVQMFEPLFGVTGQPALNETDCPLFALSRTIEAVEGFKVL